MQLMFEVYESAGANPASTAPKLFTEAGGVIGRGAGCDWSLPTPVGCCPVTMGW